jgi:flagellar biosynthesis/type III secretory pathway protein FliH
MSAYVERNHAKMFEKATEAVMSQLDGIAADIQDKLVKAVEDVIRVITDNFSSVLSLSVSLSLSS